MSRWICILTFSSIALLGRGTDEHLDDYFEALAKNQIVITQDSIQVCDSILFSLISSDRDDSFACERFLKAQAVVAFGVQFGLESSLFPDVLTVVKSGCISSSPHYHYIIGNGFFAAENFEKAMQSYLQVDSSRVEPTMYTLTRMNLSATYAQLGEVEIAIAVLERLIAAKLRNASELPWRQDFTNRIKINLGALYSMKMNYAKADEILWTVDTTNLGEYWSEILEINRFLVKQAMFDFSSSGEIWRRSFYSRPLNSLPSDLHEPSVREAVMAGDFAYFIGARASLLNSRKDSPLLNPESAYFNLFSEETGNEELTGLWNQFVRWEADHQKYLSSLKEERSAEHQRLHELESELGNQIDLNRRYYARRTVAWTAVALIVAAILAGRLVKRRRNARQLNVALSQPEKNSIPTKSLALQLNFDDVRLLGEAIAYGRRTNDAMLIVKKLNQVLQQESNEPLAIDMSQIELFEELNETEKLVVNYILSGFDAKEIARLLKFSISHIYNTRSKIRLKLGIPENDSIEDWLLQHVKV